MSEILGTLRGLGKDVATMSEQEGKFVLRIERPISTSSAAGVPSAQLRIDAIAQNYFDDIDRFNRCAREVNIGDVESYGSVKVTST